MTVAVRALREDDYPRVAEIYQEGIEAGDATFETRVPSWEEWNAARFAVPRLVAEVGGEVVGFAALSPVSSRAVYAGVAEVMVYVAATARGVGVGAALLGALVHASEAEGIWTLQAGIFPENRASLAIHAKAGFRQVGRREALGRFHDGRWRDVVVLERRSRVAGRD